MADKKQRIQNLIAKNISEIIFTMKNDVTNLASVNEVSVNRDNSIAKIYVTHLKREEIDHLLRYLNGHKGQIRSKLAKTMDTYKVPELVFVKDKLFDKGAKIDEIINSWHKDEN
ncbi:MAG: 30S ribosome-binding factor RbfA [Bacilli bacterium]